MLDVSGTRINYPISTPPRINPTAQNASLGPPPPLVGPIDMAAGVWAMARSLLCIQHLTTILTTLSPIPLIYPHNDLAIE